MAIATHERHEESEDVGTGWLERLGIPVPLAWGFLGVLLFMIGDGVESGYLSPYLIDRGESSGHVALLFTVYGVVASVAAWFSGALSDLWGPRRTMLLGLLAWLAFQVLFLTAALPTLNFPLMMLSYGLRGLGYPLFAYGFLVWIAAVTPSHRLGSAVGWFWFAFTGGLPTIGSLLASGLIPHIGAYRTLWVAFALVALGGVVTLGLVHERHGSQRLAPEGDNPVATLVGSVSILWREPRIGVGAVVRMINTAPEFGFLVFLPVFFTTTLGFSLSGWLRLLAIMFAVNIVFNLIFGIVGDRFGWRRTVAIFGGIGSAITTLLVYYLPHAAGQNYLVSVVAVSLYGASLAGYVPISALMPSLAPEHKGQAMAALNLGAGASAFVGPALVAIFLGPLGTVGMMWLFAAMYLLSALLVTFLKLPGDGRQPAPAEGFGALASLAGGSLLGHPVTLRTAEEDDDIEAILFDIGGTRYDDDCFAQALLAAVHELAGDIDDADFWHTYDSQRETGDGSLRTSLADRFTHGDRSLLTDAAKRHWHYPQAALYPDVRQTLTVLASRYRLGIIANSTTAILEALERDGLLDVFTSITLAEQVGVEKPNRAIFERALETIGVSAERAVYVGNRLDTDIRPARWVGMRTVWMLRGEASPAPTLHELGQADAVVTSLTGLPVVLARLVGERSASWQH